jgi:glycosyltransferase involved in cell wall biosynthesis
MNDFTAILSDPDLRFGLDTPLPDELVLGKGVVLPLQGWCYSVTAPLRSLAVVTDGQATPLPNHSWARTDIFRRDCPTDDPSGNSLLSGFEGFLPFAPEQGEGQVTLSLRATLETGDIVERRLGVIRLRGGFGAVPVTVAWPSTGPRVAICMATYNPPVDLFIAQIESIRKQTHTNWLCLISDDNSDNEMYDRVRFMVKADKRFLFFQNRERLSFYENFEHALRLTPADADFVALCDQDDVWQPDKLETLLSRFDDETQLAYSDARVVNADGEVKSVTFWNKRRNNYSDLAMLMVANTITGAASMIRASLLPDVIPFPPRAGPMFHDQWIGLVAMVRGRIGYVDRPLYDYVQHSSGVIGHNYFRWPGVLASIFEILRFAPNRGRMATKATETLKQALEDYQFVSQKVMLARTLLLRFPDLAPVQRRTLERFGLFETSLHAAFREKLAAMRARRSTLNLEGLLLWSMIGVRLRNYALRKTKAALTRNQTQNPGGRLLGAVVRLGHTREKIALPTAPSALDETTSPTSKLALAKEFPNHVPILEFGGTKWLHHNLKPLTLEISDANPKRVNVLMSTINFGYVFGGYIGMFNLALRLRREGYRVRIILLERTEWDMGAWRRNILKYPGITTLFDDVEVIARFDRTIPVDVNPDDRFVATSCWAAHVAHRTAQSLTEKRFLFMAQEYEPYFLAMNSISAVFQQAYDLPQVTLFSTELLRDFFRDQRIGIYARPGSEVSEMVFSNAIQKFHPTREHMMRRQRRFLFYARPEEHAGRNLFELGMMAIARLPDDPRLDLGSWSFHGIGSLGGNMLDLKNGLPMELVPKQSLEEYIRLMPSFDVGVSLMLTPHPSLVPIEMASAGMWTVTSTFANKTEERLRQISTNLIGVEPTVEAICDGIVEAMSRVDRIDERLAGARVNWPTSWDDAFPEATIQRVCAFLGQS